MTMAPRRKTKTPGAGDATVDAEVPTTRTTRARAQAEAAAVHKTPQRPKDEKPEGHYQPSAVPRRGAPARSMSRSPESVATHDFEHSQMDRTQIYSPGIEEASSMVADDESGHVDLSLGQEQDYEDQEVEEEHDDNDEEDHDEEIRPLQEILAFHVPDLGLWAGRMYDGVVKAESVDADQFSLDFLSLIQTSFDKFRRYITPSDTLFIIPSKLRHVMSTIDSPIQSALVHKTIATANTALLLKLILLIKHGKTPARPVLDEVNLYFPGLFRFDIIEDDFTENSAAYDIAFQIRCCILADRIRAHTNSSPVTLAAELFCLGATNQTTKQAESSLLNGPYAPFGSISMDFSEGLKERHARNMRQLSLQIKSKNRAELLVFLDDTYPLGVVIEHLNKWATETWQHNQDNQRDVKGKASARFPSTSGMVQETSPNHQAMSSANPPIDASNAAREQHTQAHVDMGDANERGDTLFVDEAEQAEPESDPIEPVVRTGPLTGSYFDGSATFDPNSSIPNERPPVAPPSNQQAIKNPLSRLNPKAVVETLRASGKAAGPSSSVGGPSHYYTNGRKRPAPIEEGDEDEDPDDDDFETDSRPLNGGRRLPIATQNAGSPAKRIRISATQSASTNDDRRSVSLSARPKMGSSSLQPHDISRLTQESRAAARDKREYLPRKPPQRRERWSEADSVALIEAIPRFMCAWSEMEKAKLFTMARTQQQIRDKARNLKVDFLKANQPLPAGFDYVALGKKEIDAVKMTGYNPERREDDIDEEGNIINNIWDPEIEFEERLRYLSQEEE